ncbi:hypothetical protein I302_102286 [Kwoniella bestiolae CBS 10118]|uniref:Uncharacterized protein n=1 Tax=Kwoniella bestiolae CBS 10118 TaxID=1296100 RepID=A0A1B9GEJ4_9TREE|nr:hypothetical protein I302_00978 [Kwoniella bestiolae CBS 10118]OCF29473.1 hypothetical protein I302_00978 [Kwoniella bestiolae CBS 10118]
MSRQKIGRKPIAHKFRGKSIKLTRKGRKKRFRAHTRTCDHCVQPTPDQLREWGIVHGVVRHEEDKAVYHRVYDNRRIAQERKFQKDLKDQKVWFRHPDHCEGYPCLGEIRYCGKLEKWFYTRNCVKHHGLSAQYICKPYHEGIAITPKNTHTITSSSSQPELPLASSDDPPMDVDTRREKRKDIFEGAIPQLSPGSIQDPSAVPERPASFNDIIARLKTLDERRRADIEELKKGYQDMKIKYEQASKSVEKLKSKSVDDDRMIEELRKEVQKEKGINAGLERELENYKPFEHDLEHDSTTSVEFGAVVAIESDQQLEDVEAVVEETQSHRSSIEEDGVGSHSEEVERILLAWMGGGD